MLQEFAENIREPKLQMERVWNIRISAQEKSVEEDITW